MYKYKSEKGGRVLFYHSFRVGGSISNVALAVLACYLDQAAGEFKKEKKICLPLLPSALTKGSCHYAWPVLLPLCLNAVRQDLSLNLKLAICARLPGQ